MSSLFLAADTGGSKTIWRVLNACGETVKTVKTIGMASVEEGVIPVKQIVLDAKETIGKEYQFCSIFLSLGGPNTDEVQKALSAAWPEAVITVRRESDGYAILRAARELSCTSAVMCGTGSTAVGMKNGKMRYSGGWGPIYADGGSGGGIGKEALKMFLKSLDGEGKKSGLSMLFEKVTEGLDIEEYADRMEAKRRALNMSRSELAALAPEIYNMFLHGNREAKQLYEEAAEEIARMADDVTDNNILSSVLLCGGFFKNKPELLKLCRDHFASKSNARLVYVEKMEPITGACIITLEEAGINVNHEIFSNILNEKEKKNEICN